MLSIEWRIGAIGQVRDAVYDKDNTRLVIECQPYLTTSMLVILLM